MNVDWAIFYGDRLVYSNLDGPVEGVPKLNTQIVLQKSDRVEWEMIRSSDYYVWRDTFWRGVDIFGLFDYLSQPGSKVVLFGRTILNSEFDLIYRRVKSLRSLGRKQKFLSMDDILSEIAV